MNAIFRQDTYTETSEPEARVAIYCRLSKDDESEGESSSIQTQRAMLEHYCAQQGWEVAAVYQDDGFTGLNMNRPDLMKMLEAIQRKKIDVVVTKDLSRLGRNYIQTGQLIEEFFPRHGVRYIAVNDSVDTATDSAYDMTPFRAVMNQMYSADVSKKVHSAYLTKARSGQFTGCLAPFGYKKDALDKNHLVPDEDTAWIVKLIFGYAREGFGPNYIRRRLEDQEVPCPAWWNRKKGLRNKFTKFELADPENGHLIWDFTTIKEILQNPVYIGAIASQKQVYKFKTGWLKDKQPHEWLVVEGMHEPLIDRDTFMLVQEKIKSRKRPDAFGNYSIFAGLVKCGQCGSTLNIRRANQKGNERIYTCAKYNRYGVRHCSQHRMKYDVLYGILLEQICGYAAKALEDEVEVLRQLNSRSQDDFQSERALIQKGIAEDTARLAALEKLIVRLYEDMVAERISTENFNTILTKSQSEQTALRERLTNNQARLDRESQELDDQNRWLELIKEYADIRELDATTLQRLVQKIVVHEDVDGEVIRQTVEIHFNFMSQPDTRMLVRE
jgi:site-specific DNA recombinase